MGQYHPLPQPCLTYTSLISLMGLLLKKKWKDFVKIKVH
jgi:hypothetical protein